MSQVKPTRMVVAGGVARNETLRQLLHKLAAESHVALHYAPPEYCTGAYSSLRVALACGALTVIALDRL